MNLASKTSQSAKEYKHIYFIGIGGIGISAIARMMLGEGKKVSGSDVSSSLVTEELEKVGVKIYLGQKKENMSSDVDLVVYTIAIPKDNPELVEAKKRKIETVTYPEMLGRVSKEKYTIAVSGTHGKTTTTAMIAKILMDAKLDPTVIVGSFLKDVKSNFVAGQGKFFVVEACEYRRSFLNLHPTILVVTNVDSDHLDYYKDLKDISSAFSELASQVISGGYIVSNKKNVTSRGALASAKAKQIDYGEFRNTKLALQVPGRHNIENAAAALSVAHILGIPKKQAEKSLADFSGTWRRFDFKGKTTEGAFVYDDYAHHPTEIKATLESTRVLFPNKKITLVFQPHLYSRTKLLVNDFANSLGMADRVFLVPIYAAREKEDKTITSSILAEKVKIKNKNIFSLDTFEAVKNEILKTANSKDVIITMGAGDIYKVGEMLIK